jgi:hypothetical protein
MFPWVCFISCVQQNAVIWVPFPGYPMWPARVLSLVEMDELGKTEVWNVTSPVSVYRCGAW